MTQFTSHFLTLPNYARNLRRLGFTDRDLEGAGSSALVDAVVAWGSMEQITARIHEHVAAGASEVCIYTIRASPTQDLVDVWEQLTAALT